MSPSRREFLELLDSAAAASVVAGALMLRSPCPGSHQPRLEAPATPAS
jgi:hypothetical protein